MLEILTSILYGTIAITAVVVLAWLLHPATKNRKPQAIMITVGLLAMMPTYFGLVASAVRRAMDLSFQVFWWPLADCTALIAMAVLLHLALSGEQAADNRRDPSKSYHVIYVPAVLLAPLFMQLMWPPGLWPAWLPRPGVTDHELEMVLAALLVIYALTAIVAWHRHRSSPSARMWIYGITAGVLVWCLVDLTPAVFTNPHWRRAVDPFEVFPHTLIILMLSQTALNRGLIHHPSASRFNQALRASVIVVFALAGGTAVGDFMPPPWELPLATGTALTLVGLLPRIFGWWLDPPSSGVAFAPAAGQHYATYSRLDPTSSPAAFAGAEPKPAVEDLPSPTRTGTQLPDLTERQHEVLDAVIQGLSNLEIARQLNITEATVKKHLTNIYARFNVSNRTELVIAVLKIRAGGEQNHQQPQSGLQ